jgi:hypothetical protein
MTATMSLTRSGQPEETKIRGADIWLGQDGRMLAQGKTQGAGPG